MYPNAKFIHIHRSPYDVIYSMVKFMSIVLPRYCVQAPPSIQEMEHNILDTYVQVYKTYLLQREQFTSDQLIDISYEQFITDPLPLLQRIYDQLSIGKYEELKKDFESYTNAQKNFRTSSYHMNPEKKENIYETLKFAFDAFGYKR